MNSKRFFGLSTLLPLGLLLPAFGQDPAPPLQQPSGGWRKFGDSRPPDARPSDARPPDSRYNDAPPAEGRPADPADYRSGGPLPGELTLPAGSWITVHVNQPLSSDHNQPGDAFTATLAQPLVANGLVIARRGQMIGGRVAEVLKAGHVKGVSRLGIELTELTLADGQQVPIRTQGVERRGDTSRGTDAGAIAAGTGVGAAIGAAADGGFGAGMGAIAGAAASTIGVLSTRGRATVVYPEMLLTFRLEAPIAVSTARAEQAFQPVRQEDYEPQHRLQERRPSLVAGPPPAYYGGYDYPYYYGPHYWGPGFWGSSFYFSTGPRFYGRGYYRRR